MNAPDGTPTALLYLELGCIPLKEIIKCRRINYLYNLLKRDEQELLSKFFRAQMRNPTKGDWIHLVKEDLKDFNISENFDEIAKMSKLKFKKRVAIACKEFTFKKLIFQKNGGLNENETKGRYLKYNKFTIQNYLISGKLSKMQAILLFKIRTKMLQVKTNFSHMYINELNDQNNLQCEQCQDEVLDSQEHIPLCSGLNKKVNINYNDLFSSDIDMVKKGLIGFEMAWSQRLKNIAKRENVFKL